MECLAGADGLAPQRRRVLLALRHLRLDVRYLLQGARIVGLHQTMLRARFHACA